MYFKCVFFICGRCVEVQFYYSWAAFSGMISVRNAIKVSSILETFILSQLLISCYLLGNYIYWEFHREHLCAWPELPFIFIRESRLASSTIDSHQAVAVSTDVHSVSLSSAWIWVARQVTGTWSVTLVYINVRILKCLRKGCWKRAGAGGLRNSQCKVTYWALFTKCQLALFGYPDWGFSALIPQL